MTAITWRLHFLGVTHDRSNHKIHPFAPCDHVAHHLFAVQPDIPLIDALEHASVYFNCAEALAHQAPTATRPEHSGSLHWASQQMLNTARALVLASVAGLHAAQVGGEA